MVEVGNRVIFDQDGEVIVQLGEMRGDVTPRKENVVLDYIDIDYGNIDYSKYYIIGIDVETREPILQEIEEEETEELIAELEAQLKALKNGGEA